MKTFIKNISEMNHRLKNLEKIKRVELLSLCASIFLILFSYPFIRSASEAIFLTQHQAKDSPYVWMLSVLFLGILISVFNNLVKTLSLFKVYLASTILFGALILTSLYFISFYPIIFSYLIFILKEVYIVILLHLIYLYINTHIEVSLAKIVFGPFGAIGSLGGVLGGVLVTTFIKNFSPEWMIFFGVLIFISSLCPFYYVSERDNALVEEHFRSKPLTAIREVKKQVFLILALVVLSQFAVNIVQYKFNFYIQENFSEKVAKTEVLAKVYTWVNSLSLVFQIVLIPYLLRVVKLSWIHLSVPIFYIICTSLLFGTSIMQMVVVLLIGSKALDYSLFSTAKEILYFSLNPEQKYGAKYLVDMVGYRFGKGLISFLLVFVQSPSMVNLLLLFTLVLWVGSILALGIDSKKAN